MHGTIYKTAATHIATYFSKRESSLRFASKRETGTSSCLKILLLHSLHKDHTVSRIREPSPFADVQSDRTVVSY
jgi:hypothetical protein